MVVEARQSVQFFRQKTWFLGNNIPVNIRLDEEVLNTSFVLVFKTSSRRFDQGEYVRLSLTSSEDVLVKTIIFVLAIRLQDVFKKSCKNVFKTSSRRLQDILKTSSRRLAKISSRRFQDVSSS